MPSPGPINVAETAVRKYPLLYQPKSDLFNVRNKTKKLYIGQRCFTTQNLSIIKRFANKAYTGLFITLFQE